MPDVESLQAKRTAIHANLTNYSDCQTTRPPDVIPRQGHFLHSSMPWIAKELHQGDEHNAKVGGWSSAMVRLASKLGITWLGRGNPSASKLKSYMVEKVPVQCAFHETAAQVRNPLKLATGVVAICKWSICMTGLLQLCQQRHHMPVS